MVQFLFFPHDSCHFTNLICFLHLGREALAVCGHDSCPQETFHLICDYWFQLAGIIYKTVVLFSICRPRSSVSLYPFLLISPFALWYFFKHQWVAFQVLQPSRFLREIPHHLLETQVRFALNFKHPAISIKVVPCICTHNQIYFCLGLNAIGALWSCQLYPYNLQWIWE